MFAIVAGALIMFVALNSAVVLDEPPAGRVHLAHLQDGGVAIPDRVTVKPKSETSFHGIVRQAYDYSCGSAALTTLLNGYLGRQFSERQVMEGLLRFGETDKIVARRGFSLLDMKRLVTALGHPSGGFRAEFDDIKLLDHPAIVPIGYAGFKHFVIVKGYKNGHVYVADPALGNISFTEDRFQEIWTDQVVFIVFPNGFVPRKDLELAEEDLRVIDDYTIRQLAFKEPEFYTMAMEQAADRAATMTLVEIINADGRPEVISIPQRTYFNAR